MSSDSRDRPARFILSAIVGVIALAVGSAYAGSPAGRLLADAGVKGGLVVHVGCGDGRLTAALRANERVVVQGLDRDPANVAKAREHVHSLGVYGPVSVDHWTSAPRLPYADNLVNLIVASGKGQVSSEDIARVLAPRGRVLVASGSSLDTRPGRGRPALTLDTRSPAGLSGWMLFTKPVPRAIDEWTHTLHDASNNAVADDTVVAPPRRTHWIAEPRNARHHESLASVTVAVSAGGRLFSIIDEAPTASVLLRPEWALVARDAFSGIVLWKRPIPTWEPHLRGFRSGPPELSRRLVASGDPSTGSGRGRVYVTLGIDAPLTALDAATGETVKTYDGTQGTEEIRLSGGVLYLVVRSSERPGAAAAADARTKPIVASRAETGEVIWKKPDARPLPTTVAIGGGRLAYLDGKGVVALDAKTGRELWRKDRQVAMKRPGWSAATLVIHDGVVLCADRQPKTASTLDESTGKIVRRIASDRAFKTTMPHHRCHRNRATRRFIVAGRTGVEFIDLASGEGFRHHWVRGTCQFGTLPCNGLLYAPPHSCACYIEAKLTGFLALATPGKRPLGKPKEPGLIAHWTLDEGVGPTAKDSSGVGNDAEMNGRWVKGAFGTCVSTQGGPGALTIWDNESLRFGTGDFSLVMWVYAERFDCRLLGTEDFPRNWWVINILANGKPLWRGGVSVGTRPLAAAVDVRCWRWCDDDGGLTQVRHHYRTSTPHVRRRRTTPKARSRPRKRTCRSRESCSCDCGRAASRRSAPTRWSASTSSVG